MAQQAFTLQTAQQFINELADMKVQINVCDVNENSAPLRLMNKQYLPKESASPSDVQFATLVAELVNKRLELPVSIKLFHNDPNDTDILGLQYEARVYQFITANIIETKISPNFVSFVSYGCCNDNRCYLMTEKVGSGVQFGQNKLFPVKSLFNLYDLLRLHEKYQVLFQIVYSLEVMSRFKIMHNDLHDGNILVMILKDPITLKYIVSGKTFVVQTKFIPYLFDWDTGYIEIFGDNPKLDEFFQNINASNNFDPIRDVYTLFCYLEYLKKGRSTAIGSTYAKNPTLMAKEGNRPIPIKPLVKEQIENSFQPNRIVNGKKIYKLTSAEFESFVGKLTTFIGLGEIYFYFENAMTIIPWNPWNCRLASKSINFYTPEQFIEKHFNVFKTIKEVETPFVYRLPSREEINAKLRLIA